MLDDFGADSEIGRPLRCSWPRRDNDIVELLEHADLELGPVIGHERRSTPVHFGEEMKEIERERIGIVDEQSPQRPRRSRRPVRNHLSQAPSDGSHPTARQPPRRATTLPSLHLHGRTVQ